MAFRGFVSTKARKDPMELWKAVEYFPGYEVSDYGRVKSERSGRLLAINQNQFGVATVGMMRDLVQHHRSVSRLVATAFLPRLQEPFDTPINVDGDRLNNAVDNLMWRPRWFAVLYNRQFREPYENSIPFPIQDMDSKIVSPNSYSCAIQYGLLERDVVLSILNNTLTWPTYQRFRVVE